MNTKEILQGIKNWTVGKLDTKVNKVTGKGLSTNDYTNAEKTKLSGIEEGAGANIVEGYYYNKKFYKEAAHTTEITGADGRIYVDKDTNREYRFDGTKYVLLKSEVDGSFVNEGTFTYRPTAGALDVESGAVGEGGAQIESVKGNTIAWNQLVLNNFIEINRTVSGSDYFIADLCVAGSMIIGHKLLYRIMASSTTPHTLNIQINDELVQVTELNPSVVKIASINTIKDGPWNNFRLYLVDETEGTIFYAKSQVIDLTLIYGEGNEPTTVEQFEADYQKWFGKPLTYEDYDAGSLRSVEMTGIKTVGFNAWDEEWENAWISDKDGIKRPIADQISSKNFIKVLPNISYNAIKKGNNHLNIYGYDSDYNYIRLLTSLHFDEAIFETPQNCHYIQLTLYGDDVVADPIYHHDICINLSHSGDRNGDYEPYWEHTASLPVTQLKGKLNGEGSSVVVFPDGMKKAGTVYDEIVKRGNQTVAIKRIGAVDMGTIAWDITDSENKIFMAYSAIGHYYKGGVPNMCCTIYTPVDRGYLLTTDKSISSNYDGPVHVRDTSYSDAATFKTAMQGVMLYYELATPQEYIIDDIDFPTEYPVDDYGTEEILADSAKSLAPTLDIRYGLNATDTLRNLPSKYVSAVEEQNFTEAQKARARVSIGAVSLSDVAGMFASLPTTDPAVAGALWNDGGVVKISVGTSSN